MLRGQPASSRFVTACSLLFLAATLIFYFPGDLGWDATSQWHDARTGHLVTHHPPFMAFVWHWLDLLVPGPGLFLALQLALFWLAAGLLLQHARASRMLVAAGCLFLALNPIVIAHSAQVEKNVISGNFALLAWAVLLFYPASRRRNLVISAAFVLIALAGLMRYQFWALALPAIASIAIADVRTGQAGTATHLRHAALALTVLALSVGAAQLAMQSTLDVRPSTDRNAKAMMIYDIGAALAASPNADLRIFASLGIDTDALRAGVRAEYTPYPMLAWTEAARYDIIANRLGATLHEPTVNNDNPAQPIDMRDFTRQWFALFSAEPGIFLQTRLLSFVRLLGIGGDVNACWPLTAVGYLGLPAEDWKELNGAALKESYATTLLRSRIFPAGTLLFRPVTYLVLSIALLAWWLRDRRTAPVFVCGMIVATWIYWLTFPPFNTDCEVRYSYFSCTAVLFALTYWGISTLGGGHRLSARGNTPPGAAASGNR